jgi:hypothetical protein
MAGGAPVARLYADGRTVPLTLVTRAGRGWRPQLDRWGRPRVLGNPSPIGVTWGWLELAAVEEDPADPEVDGTLREAGRAAGFLLVPIEEDDEWVRSDSSVAEFYALLLGLEHLAAVAPGWSGQVCADSLQALRRALGRTDIGPMPSAWARRAASARRALGALQPVQLRSHPTAAELEALDDSGRGLGTGRARKLSGRPLLDAPRPIAVWNVEVDRLCRSQQRPALEAWRERERRAPPNGVPASPKVAASVAAALAAAGGGGGAGVSAAGGPDRPAGSGGDPGGGGHGHHGGDPGAGAGVRGGEPERGGGGADREPFRDDR